jgi:hypothetical protein
MRNILFQSILEYFKRYSWRFLRFKIDPEKSKQSTETKNSNEATAV